MDDYLIPKFFKSVSKCIEFSLLVSFWELLCSNETHMQRRKLVVGSIFQSLGKVCCWVWGTISTRTVILAQQLTSPDTGYCCTEVNAVVSLFVYRPPRCSPYLKDYTIMSPLLWITIGAMRLAGHTHPALKGQQSQNGNPSAANLTHTLSRL